MVAETDALKDTAEVILTHHECYDGTGYPKGLEKDAIPRLGRIMKILDVYCAMTSPRHYREGHATHEEAVEHLKSERGKHFDPELIDVFLEKDIGRTPAD
jgi:putative two-component system response regulator